MTERVDHPASSSGAYDEDGYYRPSGYEVLTCYVGGFEPRKLPPVELDAASPRAGFEAALLPALLRAPCVVAFSGGRDSSAVLAVATRLARRHGLPDPVPATHDFAGQKHAAERDYQELVIRELGLRDWQRFRDVDACDVLGERALRGLSRHGLLWPAMVHCHAPLVELAAGGGSIVTGEGGDEVLGSQRIAAVDYAIKYRHSPRLRTLRQLAESLAPAIERQRRMRKRVRAETLVPWLRKDVAERFVQRLAGDLTGGPLRWDEAVMRSAGRRGVTTAATNFRRIFAEHEVTYHEPFLDDAFLGPFSRAGGWRGWMSRTAMMLMLFGDVLPEELCRRRAKAQFGAVAVGAPSREFIANWQGEGVYPDVVDVEAFRSAVTAEIPVYGVQLLLQATWLGMNADSGGAKIAEAS